MNQLEKKFHSSLKIKENQKKIYEKCENIGPENQQNELSEA